MASPTTPSKLPLTMRSWQYSSTVGGMETNLTLNTVPLPMPKPTQHLIRILSTGLNPIDYRLCEEPLLHRLIFAKPSSPGTDFAGIIVRPALGSPLKAGDRVFGAIGTNFMCGAGMSEYGIGNPKTVAPMPSGLAVKDAAGLAVCGITAYQAIIPNSQPGSHIFLAGGSGGLGTLGIQIAKLTGRHVTVACSTPNIKLCKSLGADAVIDYKTQDVLTELRKAPHKFDLVIDNVGNGQSLYWAAESFTSSNAIFVTVAIRHTFDLVRFITATQYMPGFLSGAKRTHKLLVGTPDLEALGKIASWIAEGKIKQTIDREYGFGEVREAYTRLKTGRAKGKIIVNVAKE